MKGFLDLAADSASVVYNEKVSSDGERVIRFYRGKMQTPFLRKIQEKHKLLRYLERPRLGDFLGSEIIRWLLFLNFLGLAASLGLLAWFVGPIDYPLILRYNVFFGVEPSSLASWREAYHLPLFGLGVWLFNTLVAFWLYRNRQRIASYILLLGAFLTQLVVFVAAVAIVLIN